MNNIIEVNGLSKHYPDFSLSEASFTVPEGCITGFVGANGAGKPPHSVPFSDCWNQTAGKSVCSANRSLLPKNRLLPRGAGVPTEAPWPIVSAWFWEQAPFMKASPFPR